VTTPDNDELRQLVVGLASQVYYAERDGRDLDDPGVTAGLMALFPDLATPSPMVWSGNFPQTQEQLEAVLTECVHKGAFETSRRAYSALGQMITLFNDLARYAERTSPDIDVPEFLRQAGLRAASGE
jgi:hypothetical protein